MKITGVHHVAVQVRDLARAEAFYVGVLGLPVARRWPAAEGGDRSVWLDAGAGAVLMLERAASDARPPAEDPFAHLHAGWHVVALRIDPDTRQAWEARLLRADVQVAHRTAFTLYVRDPDGNRVALSHYPVDPLNG